MNPIFISALSVAGGLFVFVGFAVLVKMFYVTVSPGQALIVNRPGDQTVVSFTGGLVLPIIHRAETMDLSVKMIEIERRGREGLICKDNVRADVKVVFFVQIGRDVEKVKQVAARIGTARASHVETLHALFSAKFSEALITASSQMNFVQLHTDRADFRMKVYELLGTDFDGYELIDVVIDSLEQTPLDALDPENILDSEGIRAITAVTKTNRQRNEVETNVKRAREKAKAEGKADGLRRLLRQRFGSLSERVEARIAEASMEELDRWFDRVLTAGSAEAVVEAL